MLYPANYFDNCNGLIPQIVLCILLLNASKEKTFKNAIYKDISDSANWKEQDNVLNLDGYLPLMESRYLVSTSDISERIGALNTYNVALLSDVVGMPFAGFPTWDNLEPVVIPANVPNLSTGQLIVEKRLACLLFQLEKRNRYYELYNYLRYVKLASTGYLYEYNNQDGKWYPGTFSFNSGERAYLRVINVCIDALTTNYPEFKLLLDLSDRSSNRLVTLGSWLQERMTNFDVMIPRVDANALTAEVSSFVETYRDPSLLTPFGSALGFAEGEGNGNIVDGGSSSDSGGSGVETPPSFNTGSQLNDEPLEEDLPVSFNILNGDRPLNSLPEC